MSFGASRELQPWAGGTGAPQQLHCCPNPALQHFSPQQCLFLVWCMAPVSWNGSQVLYHNVIRPCFLKHHRAVDSVFSDLSTKALDAASAITREGSAGSIPPLCPTPLLFPPPPPSGTHPSHDGSPAPLVVSLLSTPPGAVLHTLLSSRARLAAEVAPQLSVAVRNNLISTASVEPKPCFCKPCSRKPSSCKPCSSWPHSCSPPGSPLQMFSRLSPLPQPRTSPSRWAQCGVRPSPDALSLSRSLRGRREAGTGSEEQMMHRDNAGLSPAPAPLVSGSPPPPQVKRLPIHSRLLRARRAGAFKRGRGLMRGWWRGGDVISALSRPGGARARGAGGAAVRRPGGAVCPSVCPSVLGRGEVCPTGGREGESSARLSVHGSGRKAPS